MTLAEFLAARLGEDERAIGTTVSSADYCDALEGVHLSKERALREVRSKRAILAEHPLGSGGHCQRCVPWAVTTTIPVPWPCAVRRILAAVWSDHADWQEEWE